MPLRKQKIIVIISLVLLATAPHFVSAAGLVPCGNNGQAPCTVIDIFTLVAQVTDWLIGISGVYAVFKIIQAAFGLVTSVGNEESITNKKKQIENAILGFVFVMMAYIFVNTAVNFILLAGVPASCQLNLKSPLDYLTIKNPGNCTTGE
jgi:hypothetical protein